MDNEVIEEVSRCRMDIQELKGMMKMHFKENVHHHCPCKLLMGLRKELLFLSLIVGCVVLNAIVASINGCLSRNHMDELARTVAEQKEGL